MRHPREARHHHAERRSISEENSRRMGRVRMSFFWGGGSLGGVLGISVRVSVEALVLCTWYCGGSERKKDQFFPRGWREDRCGGGENETISNEASASASASKWAWGEREHEHERERETENENENVKNLLTRRYVGR